MIILNFFLKNKIKKKKNYYYFSKYFFIITLKNLYI